MYAFVTRCDKSVWSQYDWTKLTTIALVEFYDAELMCFAHQNNVKVVHLGKFIHCIQNIIIEL